MSPGGVSGEAAANEFNGLAGKGIRVPSSPYHFPPAAIDAKRRDGVVGSGCGAARIGVTDDAGIASLGLAG